MSCCLQVTSYSLALREIDTVQDIGDAGPDGGYVPNALEVVLRKKHLDMLQVRRVAGGCSCSLSDVGMGQPAVVVSLLFNAH